MAVAKMKKLGQDDSEEQKPLNRLKDIGSAVGNTARTFLMPEAVPEGERVYQDSEGPVPPSQTPAPPNTWYQSYGRFAPPTNRMAPIYDDGGEVAPSPMNLPQESFDPNSFNIVGQSAVDSAAQATPETGMHKAEDAISRAGAAMDDPSTMPGQTANTKQQAIQGLDKNYMAPMYDDGGKVEGPDLKKTPVKDMTSSLSEKVRQNMMSEPDQYPKSVANTKDDTIDPEELDKYNQSKAAARMKPAVPVYDDGGPVKNDPNDGHHQMAILEEGERVLTPEENKQYEAEHGAPADFGGRVLQQPNPPVRPMMDTEHPDTDRISGGAKPDISNPPAAEISPAMMRTMSATTPAKPTMAPPSGITAPKPASEGAPSPTNLPAGSADAGAANAVGQSAMMQPEHNPMATSSSAQPLPNERQKLESERAALKQKMVDAAEGKFNNGKFDHLAYGEAKMALADLNKAHPWGQPGNHEGVLGKIGHGLAVAGELASDAVMGPGFTAAIPGTRENLMQQETQGAQQIQQGLGQKASEAETGLKQAQAQVAGMPKSSDEAIARAQFRMDHSQPGTPEHETAKKELESNIGNVGKVAGAKQDVKPVKLQDQLGEIERQLLATDPNTDPEQYASLQKKKKDVQDTIQQSAKLVERQREILAHAQQMGITDAATNPQSFSKAQLDYDKSTTAAKAEGGLPVWKSKAAIQNDYATQRALLMQNNAKADEYGLQANKERLKADSEFGNAISSFNSIKNILSTADENTVAANVIPMLTTLGIVSTEGKVKRLNKSEYEALSPARGSAYRWASAHADRISAGQLPDGYKEDVNHLLDQLIQEQRDVRDTKFKSIDTYLTPSGQQLDVKENKKGGTTVTPKKAQPTPPTENTPTATGGKPRTLAEWRAQQKQQPKQ